MLARPIDGMAVVEPTFPDVGPAPIPLPRPPPVPGRPTFSPRGRRRLARPVLPDIPPLFDWLAQHFSPGEATVWVGPPASIEPMLELLYAGNALARGRISLIEGANRFHPYRIAEAGRSVGTDPDVVLERIRLARAFTAYQLVSLVEGWARELRHRPASLLVGHDLPALFFTDELPEEERAPLLRHVSAALGRLLRTSSCPMLLTLNGGFSEFPGLTEVGPRLFDMVRIRTRPTTVDLVAYRDGGHLNLVARPPGQVGLEAFRPVESKEVIAPWGAPRRRTGRRSKSG